MKKNLVIFILFILTSVIFSQTQSIEIAVSNDTWSTGDVFSNINTQSVYNGDIMAGTNWIMPWVDMRGWAEFDVPTSLKTVKLISLKLKIYVSTESYSDDNAKTGSHNLVITQFPFEVREDNPLTIIDYFDNLEYTTESEIYGVNWFAGESIGNKEISLDEDALSEISYCINNDEKFRVGFWEYNDNASTCTIMGNNSEYPPKLVIEYE